MSTGHFSASELLRKLNRERPKFHGPRFHRSKAAGSADYSLSFSVLEWITETLAAGSTTLETGCGYSTAILAALSSSHTTVSPFASEHDLVRRWCGRHHFSLEHVEFVARASQEALPTLVNTPLDLVLIDGDHAFPAPLIDWYYTADRLKVGGFCIVDDTHFWPCKILHDYLVSDVVRWRLVIRFKNTTVFSRIDSAAVAKSITWDQQPDLVASANAVRT